LSPLPAPPGGAGASSAFASVGGAPPGEGGAPPGGGGAPPGEGGAPPGGGGLPGGGEAPPELPLTALDSTKEAHRSINTPT